MQPTCRVLVVYQHLPHYRYGVFKSLESIEGCAYEFAASVSSRDGTIPTIPPEYLRSFHQLQNVWIGRFLWQRGLMSHLWRGGYDVVVFLGDASYISTWLGAIVARLKRRRVAFWTIGWHRRDVGLARIVRIKFYRLADRLLLYGRVAYEIGRSLGYPPDRMGIVGNSHYPMPSDNSKAGDEAFGSILPPGGGRTVGAIVRLNAAKRLDLLIRAAAILNSREQHVTVVLVGEGPERASLESLAIELGVSVIFAGAVYDPDAIALFYQRVRLTVVPVYAGLTALQSMRHGRPVLTSDNPFNQAPESECIIRGETGDVYRDGSVDDLAEKIDEWLNLVSDSTDIADRCRREIEQNWSAEAHARVIHAEVSSFVGARSRR